jgi:hypothetical protein
LRFDFTTFARVHFDAQRPNEPLRRTINATPYKSLTDTKI